MSKATNKPDRGKVLRFPDRRPTEGLPGYRDAETLVERLGPAAAMRVAEYIIIEAAMATKTPIGKKGRVHPAPWLLAGSSVDVMMVVRKLADLYEFRERDPQGFAKADREFHRNRQAARRGRR
jgi:hypothetical protein